MKHDSDEKLVSSSETKYLEIAIKETIYCIPLADISEVVPQFEISEVPLAPPYFSGLINLRGKIISVIDLSKKLKNELTEIIDKKTCVVIFNIDSLEVGALVDRVVAVRSIPDSLVDPHKYVNDMKNDFISGIIKSDRTENKLDEKSTDPNLRFLLDLEKLLDIDEIRRLNDQETA